MTAAIRGTMMLVLMGFLAVPLWADVIPTRYEGDLGAAQKVESRLTELGLDARGAGQLTDEEMAYFAAHPARLQMAGQELFGGQSDNFWWEWLFGAASLAGAGVLIYFIAFD